jgi:hypothetical protein
MATVFQLGGYADGWWLVATPIKREEQEACHTYLLLLL